MAIKLFLVLTCFSLACCIVWAGPSKVVVRSEEGRWITEVVTLANDGWPEITSRKSFATQDQAQQHRLFWQKKFPSQVQSTLRFAPQTVKGVLWTTTQSWTEEWEQKYAKWIEDEVDTEFFVRYKVATDCADVAYSLRWIFARMHGLPAAANLGASNVLLTNETVRANWGSLPTAKNWYEDRRFLTALNYLLDLTYTHTLWGDSFPVALNKQALLSGSYHLGLGTESGHTQVIHWMDSQSGVPFLTLNSTVPRKVRSLSDSMLFAQAAKDKKNAILRFRWAVKSSSGIFLKKPSEMPGFSLEQYSFNPQSDYTIALFEKLGYTGGREGIRDYLYKDILAQFKSRVDIVREGRQQCQNGGCAPGTPAWEEWSTPSRDSRIKGKIASLNAVGTQADAAILSEVILTIDQTPWTFKSLLYNWKFDEYNSDPQVSESDRWGAGGTTWAQRHVQTLQAKVQERQEVLRKGALACAGKNCQFGTELWKKTSSNDIDQSLVKEVRYLTTHDGALPAQAVQALDSFHDTVLAQISGRPITLAHLIGSLASMNSSALASVDKQWGLGEWSALHMQGFGQPFIIDNKWALDQAGEGLTVWDLSLGEKLNLPFQALRFFGDGVLLVKAFQGMSLYNLRTQQTQSLPTALQGLTVQRLTFDKDFLVAMFPDRLQKWNLDTHTLTLTLDFEVAGQDWKSLGGNFFSSKEGLYDVIYKHQYPQIQASAMMCFGPRYAALPGGDHLLINRKTGITKYLGLRDITGFDCVEAKASVIDIQTRATKVYRWDENLEKTVEFEVDSICYLSVNALYCENRTSYVFEGGRWQKSAAPEAAVYELRPGEDFFAIVERASGKIVLKAKRINLFQDRFAAVTLALGESVHVVDLKNPSVPLLTNIFKADWGVGGAVKEPYLVLSGYNQGSEGGVVLWKLPH